MFGIEKNALPKERPKSNSASKVKHFPHEAPFKPSNPMKKVICLVNDQGVLGTIDKFPVYKENPPKELKRIDKEKGKDPFKYKITLIYSQNYGQRHTP